MVSELAGWGQHLRSWVLNALAMVLLLSLPAIWVSWSRAMILGVVATGVAAGVLYCVLYAFHAQPPRQPGAGSPPRAE